MRGVASKWVRKINFALDSQLPFTCTQLPFASLEVTTHNLNKNLLLQTPKRVIIKMKDYIFLKNLTLKENKKGVKALFTKRDYKIYEG